MTPCADYFECSLFIGPAVSRALNVELNALIDAAREFLAAREERSNLYLTGSLARREPSVRCLAPGETQLRSDVDFVLAGASDSSAHGLARELRVWSQCEWAHYNVSVVALPLRGMTRLRSCFGRDLTLDPRNVLYRGLSPEAEPRSRALSPADLMETAIHQTATYLLLAHAEDSGGLSYSRDTDYHRQRGILELLRWRSAAHSSYPARFSDLAAPQHAGLLTELVNGQALLRVLKARELGDDRCQDLDFYDILRRVAAEHLLGAASTNDALLEFLSERNLDAEDVLTRFRLAVLALALGFADSGRLQADACRIVRGLVLGCDRAQTPSFSCTAEGTRLDALELWDARVTLAALRAFRNDYLCTLERINAGDGPSQAASGGEPAEPWSSRSEGPYS